MTVVREGGCGPGGSIGAGLPEINRASNHRTVEAIPGCIRGISIQGPVSDERITELNPHLDGND